MLPMKNQESGPIECRICHSRTTRDLILSPCLCKGSMGCVHIRCLEQWLNVSSQTFCELCSYRFEVVQVRRYTFCQSLRAWVRKEHTSMYKALFFLVLTFINTCLLGWMWALWIINIPNTFTGTHDKEEEKNEQESAENEKEAAEGGKETAENGKHATEESRDISKTKWFIVFIFLTFLTAFSIKSMCFDSYKLLKSQYNAWYRWWNETVNVQLVLDLQNFKINPKLEDFNDPAFKMIQEKIQQSRERLSLQEAKVLNSANENQHVVFNRTEEQKNVLSQTFQPNPETEIKTDVLNEECENNSEENNVIKELDIEGGNQENTEINDTNSFCEILPSKTQIERGKDCDNQIETPK